MRKHTTSPPDDRNGSFHRSAPRANESCLRASSLCLVDDLHMLREAPSMQPPPPPACVRCVDLYNVHMKRYSAAEARARLADVLDAAERGEVVVIERRGVRFDIRRRDVRKPTARRRSLIERVDPAIETGQWTWELAREGLELVTKKRN